MKSRVREAIYALMKTKPLSKHSAAALVHCHTATARNELARLHFRGEAHISGWHREYNNPVPIYTLGKGKDAKKPRAMTPKEKSRKRRADIEVALQEAATRRAKRAAENYQAPKGSITAFMLGL